MSKPNKQTTMKFLSIDCNIIKIYDRQVNWGVNIQVTQKGLHCAHCNTNQCQHIEYVLTIPEVQKEIHKKIKEGWNLPEPDT